MTHVTYNPPATIALPLPLPSLSIVGAVLGSATGVSFTAACQAAAGGACAGLAKLTTVEKLRGSKVLGLSAAKHKKKAKVKKKTVVVGSKSFSIPARATQKVTVPLNATGKKLLAKFGKLPTKLTQPGGKQVTVTSRKLTLKAKKKKKCTSTATSFAPVSA